MLCSHCFLFFQVFPDITEPPKFIVNNDSLGSTSVSGLVPGSGYYVSVRAENSAGEGNFTEPQLARLLEDEPGGLIYDLAIKTIFLLKQKCWMLSLFAICLGF